MGKVWKPQKIERKGTLLEDFFLKSFLKKLAIFFILVHYFDFAVRKKRKFPIFFQFLLQLQCENAPKNTRH
jgi:hypothetical protein